MSKRTHKSSQKSQPYSKANSQTFGLRLTANERAELGRRAGEMAVGRYIKSVLFADGVKRRTRGGRAPVKDHRMLAELLACLGSSHVSESLRRLADAAETGVLQWDEDAPKAITKACEDIMVMRLMLMRSLGFQVNMDDVNESVAQSFNRAATDDHPSPRLRRTGPDRDPNAEGSS